MSKEKETKNFEEEEVIEEITNKEELLDSIKAWCERQWFSIWFFAKSSCKPY